MTQIIDPGPSVGSLSQSLRNRLEQFLSQHDESGPFANGKGSNDNVQQQRILEFLISTCAWPHGDGLPTSNEANTTVYALNIFDGIVAERPALLHATVNSDKSGTSILICKFAAITFLSAYHNYVHNDIHLHVADRIYQTLAHLVACLNVPTNDKNSDGGIAVSFLAHLISFTEVQSPRGSLFGTLVSNSVEICGVITHLVLSVDDAHVARLQERSLASLVDKLRAITEDVSAQKGCLRSLAQLPHLTRLWRTVGPSALIWSIQEDMSWQELMRQLMLCLDMQDSNTRATMWNTLAHQVPVLNPDHHHHRIRIQILCTAIHPVLTADDILRVIGADTLNRWYAQLIAQAADPITSNQVQNILTGASLKRSVHRSGNLLHSQSRNYLSSRGLDIRDEGIIKSIEDTCMDSNDQKSLEELINILPNVFGALPATSFDPDHGYSLWQSLAGFGGDPWPKDGLKGLWVLLKRCEAQTALRIFTGDARNSARAFTLLMLMEGSRASRLIAGRILCLVFKYSINLQDEQTRDNFQREMIGKVASGIESSPAVAQTSISIMGTLGQYASEVALAEVLEALLRARGSTNAPMQSLAHTQLLQILQFYDRTPYALLSPYMGRLSIMLVKSLDENPEMFAATMSLLGQTRQNFVETTLHHTVPALVLEQDRRNLQHIAAIAKKSLGMILVDQTQLILTKIFLESQSSEKSLHFYVELLKSCTGNANTTPINAASLITSCVVPFIVSLVVELGDPDRARSRRARRALREAQKVQNGGSGKEDLDAFLKPNMMGIMTQLNQSLHDVLGKKTVLYKQKLIRSIGMLISLVGGTISAFSPQIMASLSSTLSLPELRHETLGTWKTFIRTLRFADAGPYVGRTTGALVAQWADFEPLDKQIAVDIINDIAGNTVHLTPYLDEIVGMDHIPELRSAALKLTAGRQSWGFRQKLSSTMERVRSQNVSIASTSIGELRDILLHDGEEFESLSRGDFFDPLISELTHCLLMAATRGDDYGAVQQLSYECLGILGALDPDRLSKMTEPTPMTIISNFTDQDESMDFAVHLIRDVLIDVFRATNDTKLQGYLAYAVQELLRFCGFTSKMFSSGLSGVPLKIRNRWSSLPKDQLEILTSLLDSRFTANEAPKRPQIRPIYPGSATYREWLQVWTMDLLEVIMSRNPDTRAIRDSQTIFGVFRGVLRHQDVAAALQLLPHLVLNILLSGDNDARLEICAEMESALKDQVNPEGAKSKRTLSAQVIFDLMDHLSKWLRLQRAAGHRSERAAQINIVQSVLRSMETELMANAALSSGAHARALRSFEQRIFSHRHQNRSDADLQTYFERLHLIYAELEEPDGMEGVSAFVISPSLEHQIREHESTGRWTSAQSCWEVRLQQAPDDISLHEGLLRCLRNLGHYDTLRTHIRGVVSRHPEWSKQLSRLEVEAAWLTGDWEAVERIGAADSPIGQILLNIRDGKDITAALTVTRNMIGQGITTTQPSRGYSQLLELHLLRDIELITAANSAILRKKDPLNQKVIDNDLATRLFRQLDRRLTTSSPAFRTQEALLSIRRTTLSLMRSQVLKKEIGSTWMASSKIARKAGYEQTAYSATLQAKEVEAPFAFVETAKLLHQYGSSWKALTTLENMLRPLLESPASNTGDFAKDRSLAKAVLLEARWAHESDRFEANDVLERFREAIRLAPNLESPYYHLGHYYDSVTGGTPEQKAASIYHTCHNYILALQYGVKYIYQTMPRMLTLWLDLGENKEVKKFPEMQNWLTRITILVDKSRKDLATYQFLTAYPQIVSRIGHPNKDVVTVLRKLMALVIETYPHQALWPTVGIMQSVRQDRNVACQSVLQRAQHRDNGVAHMIKEAQRLSDALLRLADQKVEDKKREFSVATYFPYIKNVMPSKMIVPLQDALTCSLPSSAEVIKTHRPFSGAVVEIAGIDDRVDVMPSLQRPKKLVLLGSDGRKYPFLCKPHDDLRKDARLMDFNSMINKLLKSASESRRRQLYIRTYAVMPLNEECGLLEWVSNTHALKSILEKGYARHHKRIYTTELHHMLEDSRKAGPAAQIKEFKEKILPMFNPTVFREWFTNTWPEPTAWLASRMCYSRTLAVMSMIGYVLGLGDRHGENILFDGTTGDTVHVDLNCLFDKGKHFEIPERVPFRLTHNMVDALGVTGVEGVFRKAAEIALEILRNNTEALMSVLEAFAHDPLVEWARPGRNKSDKDIRAAADRNLRPIKAKLNGLMDDTGTVLKISSQVEILFKQATGAYNLALMYQGWAAWL